MGVVEGAETALEAVAGLQPSRQHVARRGEAPHGPLRGTAQHGTACSSAAWPGSGACRATLVKRLRHQNTCIMIMIMIMITKGCNDNTEGISIETLARGAPFGFNACEASPQALKGQAVKL